MDIIGVLNDKSAKIKDKQDYVRKALEDGGISPQELGDLCAAAEEKQATILLQAAQAFTKSKPGLADDGFLTLAKKYIRCGYDPHKREAARIAGNLARQFPNQLDGIVCLLLGNTKSRTAAVRLSAAYALGRIAALAEYAGTSLPDTVAGLAKAEEDAAVRNQYLRGLESAEHLYG